jgi:hypothetical protein
MKIPLSLPVIGSRSRRSRSYFSPAFLGGAFQLLFQLISASSSTEALFCTALLSETSLKSRIVLSLFDTLRHVAAINVVS